MGAPMLTACEIRGDELGDGTIRDGEGLTLLVENNSALAQVPSSSLEYGHLVVSRSHAGNAASILLVLVPWDLAHRDHQE